MVAIWAAAKAVDSRKFVVLIRNIQIRALCDCLFFLRKNIISVVLKLERTVRTSKPKLIGHTGAQKYLYMTLSVSRLIIDT